MGEISRFLGMVICIYNREHPPAHFHVYYAEHEAEIRIDTLEVLRGSLPRRVLSLVLEWAVLHRAELRVDWERATGGMPTLPIEPLE
jgi:hypothetical protein